MSKKLTPKILTLDIETAPIEMYAWNPWQDGGGVKMMKKDWAIIAYTAKWYGSKAVTYRDTRNKKDWRDDRSILIELQRLIEKADIILSKNGKRFDVPKIRARFMINKLPPITPHQHIDTEKMAREFGFTSYSMEYLCEVLDIPLKKLTERKYEGFKLWRACDEGVKDAWAEMRSYNIRDVECTELLFERFRGYTKPQVDMGVYDPRNVFICSHCGSDKLHSRGTTMSGVRKLRKYQCQDCNGWTCSKTNEFAKAKRAALRGKK